MGFRHSHWKLEAQGEDQACWEGEGEAGPVKRRMAWAWKALEAYCFGEEEAGEPLPY